MKTPFPIEPHKLFKFQMRVPCALEAEWAASQGLSAWEPIPEGKVLVVIGDGLELLPGHTAPSKGGGKAAIDDGMVGIVGMERIMVFCEWYFGRLQ